MIMEQGICSSDNYNDINSAEILTFDIPVHDSEKTGLGITAKGKTCTSRYGIMDIGIFVTSVLCGGAASRDGRLETDDQLVSINGMSLLGKANPVAMETVKKAMHKEGPVPGIISFSVARRKPEQKPDSHSQNYKKVNVWICTDKNKAEYVNRNAESLLKELKNKYFAATLLPRHSGKIDIKYLQLGELQYLSHDFRS